MVISLNNVSTGTRAGVGRLMGAARDGANTQLRALVVAVATAGMLLLVCAPSWAQTSSWISTWTASPQAPRGVMPTSFSDRTVRQTVRVSLGGRKVIVRLSNEFGTKPLLIGAASIGLAAHGSEVTRGGLRALTFGGSKSIIVPPGAPVLSDPVELTVAPLSDLAISMYLPGPTDLATVHQNGLQTAYVSAAGDFTASTEFPAVDTFQNRFFLSGVMVQADPPARTIIIFGDSITDGVASTADANRRWPDVLAKRLTEAGVRTAILNQGIGGNRVLSDGAGANALARFERDVLSEHGASHVVIFLGINDIGWPGTPSEPAGIIRTADELIAGYKQLIERAHLHSIKVIGCPLTPFENAFAGTPWNEYYTAEKEAKRAAVNAWIRQSGAFDEVIDFARVLADPVHPTAMKAAYDSGDHLHPNDAGYRAMGESVDLRLFQ